MSSLQPNIHFRSKKRHFDPRALILESNFQKNTSRGCFDLLANCSCLNRVDTEWNPNKISFLAEQLVPRINFLLVTWILLGDRRHGALLSPSVGLSRRFSRVEALFKSTRLQRLPSRSPHSYQEPENSFDWIGLFLIHYMQRPSVRSSMCFL